MQFSAFLVLACFDIQKEFDEFQRKSLVRDLQNSTYSRLASAMQNALPNAALICIDYIQNHSNLLVLNSFICFPPKITHCIYERYLSIFLVPFSIVPCLCGSCALHVLFHKAVSPSSSRLLLCFLL